MDDSSQTEDNYSVDTVNPHLDQYHASYVMKTTETNQSKGIEDRVEDG